MATHLARRDTAGLALPVHPVDCRADRNPELPGRLIARQPARLNGCNDALAKIIGIRFAHPMLASLPASGVNQNPPDLGIPNRFSLASSCSSPLVPAKAGTQGQKLVARCRGHERSM